MQQIAVAGAGYVGLSIAVLLAQNHHVSIVDVDPQKVEDIKDGKVPFADSLLEDYLQSKELDLAPTLDAEGAYSAADIIFIAVPTDYSSEQNTFDMSHVEDVISVIACCNKQALVVIKSTIPLGYTEQVAAKFPQMSFLFSPEFLREGQALSDTLHPSRVVVGVPSNANNSGHLKKRAFELCELLDQNDKQVEHLVMSATEAEAVKLFSNTYLALRVAFFNELDVYAESYDLDARTIIKAVCLDPRIGAGYNNPSFGYGGYCLPKDTKQLKANFEGIPQTMISASIDANEQRKDYIAQKITEALFERVGLSDELGIVGIYRLTMKNDSDNFRSSSMLGVFRRLYERDIPLVVYEPAWTQSWDYDCRLVNNLSEFKALSTLIVTNRWHADLLDVADKVYTRDIFRCD